MKLKEMDVGISGKIVGFSVKDRHYRQKLLRMGLVKGEFFLIIRKAPMGDPIEIKIKGYSLTLRKNEADALDVEVVK
ncbi:MAG: iron transporter FeoA [Candidatus Cloacimonas sp. SDB]|nr:MAG: iron transporter FeoA [Candidatus Cloacimonas sp. SDB]